MPPSEIGRWLLDHLQTLDLGEDTEGYLFGRGAQQHVLDRLGIREWREASTPAPGPHFSRLYGPKGHKLNGWVVIPLWSPSGALLGIEARSREVKKITEFRVPEASWNPVMIGAVDAAEKLWAGGSVWVVEGVYDLFAMSWVIPKEDAVIATLKAGLSKAHVSFFSRLCTNRIYMVYDNDETGRKATYGWVDPTTQKRRFGALELLQHENLHVVDYRYRGKDPGEVWSSGGFRKLQTTFSISGET